MARIIERMLAGAELMRIGLVWTAVSNIWMVVLLSRGLGLRGGASAKMDSLPLWAVLALTAGVAAGMYVFGMVLNDVMDARRDRMLAPARPIVAGKIAVGQAAAIAIAALMMSVACSVPLGVVSTSLCLACAGLVLFYNALAKHVPGVGVVVLGLIRGCHMLIGNPSIGFVWPVWLTVTHVIGISAAGYRLEGKRPELKGVGLWAVVGGWAFVTMGLIWWMGSNGRLTLEGADLAWVGPTAAVGVWVMWALMMGRGGARAGKSIGVEGDQKRAGGLIIKRGLLWLMIYDAAWVLSAGLWLSGVLLVALWGCAWGTMWGVRQMRVACEPGGFRRVDA